MISLGRGLPSDWERPGPGVAEMVVIGVGYGVLLMRVRARARTFRDVIVLADRRRLRGRNWAVLPTAIVLGFACACSGWLRVQLTFQLSRWSASRLSAEVAARGDVPDRRVGLIAAHAIRPTPDGMNFRVADNYECGFAHTTTGRPPGRSPWATPLGGGWYAFGFPD